MTRPSPPRRSRRPAGRLVASLTTGLVGLLTVVIMPTAAAASNQSFDVLHGQPQTGMLMSLTANPGVIEPATAQNTSSLVGVVAPAETGPGDQLDPAAAPEPGQVSVQTDGAASALVSTLGGDIRVGDRITASSLAGVGAKAHASGWIVGIAQASLDAHTAGAVKSTVADSHGHPHAVFVASLPLLVKVTYYVVPPPSADKPAWVPAVIQRAADALAGKHVSPLALILSFLLLVIGVVIAGTVVKAAIRGGFLAIARQPLSKSVILREVWRSCGLAFVILAAGLVGAWLLLRIL